MGKIAVVYWSGTGNTEKMAQIVLRGIRESNFEADIMEFYDFSKELIEKYDSLAFGCPAMENEELEKYEAEPVFSSVEKGLSGKAVALFGSYSLGCGDWMREWEQRCLKAGARIIAKPVICADSPSADIEKKLIDLGITLAENSINLL